MYNMILVYPSLFRPENHNKIDLDLLSPNEIIQIIIINRFVWITNKDNVKVGIFLVQKYDS